MINKEVYKNQYISEAGVDGSVVVINLNKDQENNIDNYNVGQRMEIVAVDRSTGEVYFRWLSRSE